MNHNDNSNDKAESSRANAEPEAFDESSGTGAADAALPADDGGRPKLNLKFKGGLDRPTKLPPADDGQDDEPDDDGKRAYRLVQPTFKASEEELAVARELVARRRQRRGCRRKLVGGLALAVLLTGGVFGYFSWRDAARSSEMEESPRVAGEGEALVSVRNACDETLTVRIGDTVMAVPAGQTRRVAVARGRYEVSWTGDFNGRSFYNALSEMEIAANENWLFDGAESDGVPTLQRSGEPGDR